jgi:tetratricopeptide (TPR) repeat protein
MRKSVFKISLSIILSMSCLSSYANTFDKNILTYEQMYDTNSMSYYKKGRLLFNKLSQKNLEEAIKTYDEGIEINRNNPLLYASKAEALFMLYIFKILKVESNIGKAKLENEIFRNASFALDLAPNLTESHRAMILAYDIQDRKEDAIQEAKKAIELNKTDPESNLWLWTLTDANNPENTNALIASSIAPDSALINFFLALSYEKKKTWNGDKQISLLKKVLKVNPDNDLAHMFLGKVYFKYNYDNNLAIKSLEKSIEIEPKNPFALFNLGLIYLNKKDNSKAFEYLKKSCDKGMQDSCETLKKMNY